MAWHHVLRKVICVAAAPGAAMGSSFDPGLATPQHMPPGHQTGASSQPPQASQPPLGNVAERVRPPASCLHCMEWHLSDMELCTLCLELSSILHSLYPLTTPSQSSAVRL